VIVGHGVDLVGPQQPPYAKINVIGLDDHRVGVSTEQATVQPFARTQTNFSVERQLVQVRRLWIKVQGKIEADEVWRLAPPI